MIRTDERNEFLTDILVCAIENYGYGWFTTEKYEPDALPGAAYAVITDDQTDVTHRIDVDTIAHGIGVIKNAVAKEFADKDGWKETVLANAQTGGRLYLGGDQRREVLACDRENDAGEIDVVLALAIVECAIFGHVMYA